MIGIVIAAGIGSRMGALTDERPKCLMPVGNRPLIDWTLDHFRHWRCNPLVAIVGHCSEAIERPDLIKIMNTGYRDNNILHSFMHAVDYLDRPVLASYSDIYVEPPVYEALMDTPGEIVLAVDVDWRAYYVGRNNHPLGEAENVYFDARGQVHKIGKYLTDNPPPGLRCGEFLGLWRMSGDGAREFRRHIDRINLAIGATEPFQNAREWRKAYITDMVQELIDQGMVINCAQVERGWAELDTVEDFQRLSEVAARQRLNGLLEAQRDE